MITSFQKALFVILPLMSLCCAPDSDRQARLELAELQKQEEAYMDTVMKMIDQEFQAIAEHKAKHEASRKEVFDRYLEHSLKTGSTPYSSCFGADKPCEKQGCSRIIVSALPETDLVAIIRSVEHHTIVMHAYIQKGDAFTFHIPNGHYEVVMYSGLGWYPEKRIKETNCGVVFGGFLVNERMEKMAARQFKDTEARCSPGPATPAGTMKSMTL